MGQYFISYTDKLGYVKRSEPTGLRSGLKDMVVRELREDKLVTNIEVIYESDKMDERPKTTEIWKRKKFCGFYLKGWRKIMCA